MNSSYRGVPPYYYPTNNSTEANAAYAAWQDQFSRQPYTYGAYMPTNPAYQPVQYPQQTGFYQPYAVMQAPAPAPAPAPVPAPTFHPHPWQMQPQAPVAQWMPNNGDDSSSDDNGGNPAYVDRDGWPIGASQGWRKKHRNHRTNPGDVITEYVPAGQAPRQPDGFGSDGRYHANWYGRSAAQIQEDRAQQAVDGGVYKKHKAMPVASATDKFWVVDNNQGVSSLRSFADINEHWHGKWKVDERYGSWYFRKGDDKDPEGWGNNA